MGDVETHFEVGTHDCLGDLELARGGARHRILVNIRVVGGRNDAVRTRCRRDDQVVEVKTNALACTKCAHAFVGLSHLFECCGT